MVHKGKLIRWNKERGFGFISCGQLEEDVFIHISTLKSSLSHGEIPTLGTPIIFKLAVENDGKFKAYQAFIEGAKVEGAKVEGANVADKHNNVTIAKRANYRGGKAKTEKGNKTSLSRIAQTVATIVILFILADRAYFNVTKPESFKPSESVSAKLPEPIVSSANKEPQPTYIFPETTSKPSNRKAFSCDGRRHCSQMTSCAEAMYFIQNCPNTKMDGDEDGIPCERQWC